MDRRFPACLAALLSLTASGAAAHHSSDMFDLGRTDSHAGTVKQFEMINPHAWLHVMIPGPNGRPVEWSLEMGDPAQLLREGWTKQVVRPGDKVTVRIHPMRDGSHGGELVSIVLPDGRSLDADTPASPAP